MSQFPIPNYKFNPIEESLISEAEQFPQTKESLLKILDQFKININDCTIHDDLSVSVQDNVILSTYELSYLPIKFKKVEGDFHCRINNLVTLRGSPEEVTGNFDCSRNQLTSLKWAPRNVGSSFSAAHNKIQSLLYCSTKQAKRDFDVSYNLLTKIEYLPEGLNSFLCHHNNITHFESQLLSNKNKITYIDISSNKITRLDFLLHQFPNCLGIDCAFNLIKSLDNLPTSNNLQNLDLSSNKLEYFKNDFAPNLSLLKLNFNFIKTIDTRCIQNVECLELLDDRPHDINYESLLELNPNAELNINYDQIEDIDLRIKLYEKFYRHSLVFMIKDPSSLNQLPRDQWYQKLIDDVITPLKKNTVVLKYL